jgi:macrodomain Ter protein organizer (MatP/YcbG family)
MPRRHDTLPAPAEPVGMRIDLDRKVRDKFRTLASSRGYTMSALVRLMIEEAVKHPKEALKKIRENSDQES